MREWCLGSKTCKELCSEAFLASRAGAVEIGDLGVDPDALGRNHARHLREILRLRDLKGSFYFVNVPVYDKRTASRVHPWIRLNRVVRDIPSQYILGGVDVPNLREDVASIMRKQGNPCK